MENADSSFLHVDEEFSPIIIEDECAAVKPIIKEFMECYVENTDKPVEEWLSQKMQQSLPV